LWYNALKIMSQLSKHFKEDAGLYDEMAEKVKKSFEEKFWNEEKKCLYDCLTPNYKDDKVRPNQILAVSLSYPVIEGEKAKSVVDIVFKELYTAYGLRSLSPKEKEYVECIWVINTEGTEHTIRARSGHGLWATL